MSQWDGKSKGTVLGYKIFVFFINKIGIRSAYFVLYFVASYYFLFLKKSNRAIYYYFHQRLGYSALKSRLHVFKSYYTFGQTIIDKVSITAGMRNKFTYEFDGITLLKELLAKKIGAGVTSLGVPLGVAVIVFTIILTWIYVRRANSEFDDTNEALIKEATK